MGYQNRADTDKERIEVLERCVNKNSKTELGREIVYEKKKGTEYPRNVELLQKELDMCNRNSRMIRNRDAGEYEIFEVMMAKNFPKLITDTKPQIQEA